MDQQETRKAMRALWPRVDPHQVISVLRTWAVQDAATVDAILKAALALPSADAATRLMAPIASVLASRSPRDRVGVLHALDALVRAGGDPSEILPIAAEALSERQTMGAAVRLLRRAALEGHILPPIVEACAGSTDATVQQTHRLASLQLRGEHAAIRQLSAAYRSQPISNLHSAIGLLEGQLLSEDLDEAEAARQALVVLAAAGADLYRCWLALLPVLLHQLRAGQQEEATRALAQLRYTLRYAAEGEETATVDVRPRLVPVTASLCALLDGDLGTAAAHTIEVFARLGASLGEVRPVIEAALESPHVGVRSACSRALSVWLQREGEEPTLSPQRSHRRTFASSDEPLEGESPQPCPACKFEQARVLYHHEDISQTHADIMVELLCPSCGLYSEQHWGY